MWFQNASLFPLMNRFTVGTVPASLLPLVLTTGLSSYLGLSKWTETLVAAGSGFFLTLSTDLQMMPANVLVAQLSARGLEGSSFSLFTVVEGIGRVCSNFSSGLLPLLLGASATNGYANMSLYIIACSAFQLAPLVTTGNTIEEPIPEELEKPLKYADSSLIQTPNVIDDI